MPGLSGSCQRPGHCWPATRLRLACRAGVWHRGGQPVQDSFPGFADGIDDLGASEDAGADDFGDAQAAFANQDASGYRGADGYGEGLPGDCDGPPDDYADLAADDYGYPLQDPDPADGPARGRHHPAGPDGSAADRAAEPAAGWRRAADWHRQHGAGTPAPADWPRAPSLPRPGAWRQPGAWQPPDWPAAAGEHTADYAHLAPGPDAQAAERLAAGPGQVAGPGWRPSRSRQPVSWTARRWRPSRHRPPARPLSVTTPGRPPGRRLAAGRPPPVSQRSGPPG